MKRLIILLLVLTLILFLFISSDELSVYFKLSLPSWTNSLVSINSSPDIVVTDEEYETAGLNYPYKQEGKFRKINLDPEIFRIYKNTFEMFYFGQKTPKEVRDEINEIEKSLGWNKTKEQIDWLAEQKKKISKYDALFSDLRKDLKKDLRKTIDERVDVVKNIRKKIAVSAMLKGLIISFSISLVLGIVLSATFGFTSTSKSSAPFGMAKASGRWATPSEIYRYFLIFTSKQKNIISSIPVVSWLLRRPLKRSKNAFPLGKLRGNSFLHIGISEEDRNSHLLVCAPTGAGKTTNIIEPALLNDAYSEGSAFVIDAKSPELYNTVAGAWMKAGKKTILFDPWHPSCLGFEPLKDANSQDLLTIVRAFMGTPSKVAEDQRFFRGRTQSLLFALLKLTQTFPAAQCNLAVTYILAQNVPDLEHQVQKCGNEKVKILFKNFLMISNDQKINMLESVCEKLQMFRDEQVQAAFSRSDFDISVLFREKDPTLLVVGAPHDKGEIATQIASLMARLVINRAFEEKRLKEQKESAGKTPAFTPPPLYIYLDEFPSLNIPDIDAKLRMARSTRTQIIICVQDLSEIEALYLQHQSLIANLRTKIFLTGCHPKTCEFVSVSLGKTRTDTARYSKKILSFWPGSKYKQQEEDLLMSTDSIQNMPKGMAIFFNTHTRPALLKLQNKDNSREIASKIISIKDSGVEPYRPNPEPLKPPALPAIDQVIALDRKNQEEIELADRAAKAVRHDRALARARKLLEEKGVTTGITDYSYGETRERDKVRGLRD